MLQTGPFRPEFRRLLILIALTCAAASLPAKVDWDPVAQADLDSKQCAAFPGVSAEDIFRYQTLNYVGSAAQNEYYLRRKVYNAKAAQDLGLLNIEYASSHSVSDLAARVIKPNGQIIELGKKDFVDSVVAKNKNLKIKSKSVAVPNLDAGDIVEYRWSESTESTVYRPRSWFIQSVYPTRLYRFTLERTLTDCNVLWFNVAHAKKEMVKGRQTLTVTDIPPYEEEPMTPPERDLRGTLVIIDTDRWAQMFGKESLWKDLSDYWGENYRLEIKPGGDIKAAAKKAIGDAKTSDEKIERLYNFVRSEISNLDYFDDGKLQEARRKLDNKSGDQLPDATLAKKTGESWQVNQLFASLCVAAGFDVRVSHSSSRNATTLVNGDQGFVFLNDNLVRVKVDNAWKFYSPGDYYVPSGLVDWQFESAPGLVCEEDVKKIEFTRPAPAPAAASEEVRIGALAINADGDCEGTVKITYTGHLAVAKKYAWVNKTTQEIEKAVREDLAERLPTAELSEFKTENASGMELPIQVSYRLKVPGYAEAAGDRMIFAPAIFQKGTSPVFKNSTRKWPISFPYASRVRDEITLKLPDDFELDSPSAPQSVGQPEDAFHCRYKISIHKKDHSVFYSREVVIGDQGLINLPVTAYEPIKKVFDSMITSDNHTLVIKPKAAAAEASPAPPAAKPASS